MPQCIIRDTLTVVPFHPPSNPNVSYNFHGICEHIISKPCDSDRYLIVGDFLAQNLTMGRVGIQTRDGYSIIHEDLSVHSSDPPPTDVTVEGTTGKVTLSFNGSEAVVMRTAESIDIRVRSGVTCGLCGRRNGTLVSAGGDVLDDVMNQTKVNNFASSWQRAPSDQILRDDRRECGKSLSFLSLCLFLLSLSLSFYNFTILFPFYFQPSSRMILLLVIHYLRLHCGLVIQHVSTLSATRYTALPISITTFSRIFVSPSMPSTLQ